MSPRRWEDNAVLAFTGHVRRTSHTQHERFSRYGNDRPLPPKLKTRASGLLVVIVLRRGVTLCVTRDAVGPRRWEDNAVLAFTGHVLESQCDKKG